MPTRPGHRRPSGAGAGAGAGPGRAQQRARRRSRPWPQRWASPDGQILGDRCAARTELLARLEQHALDQATPGPGGDRRASSSGDRQEIAAARAAARDRARHRLRSCPADRSRWPPIAQVEPARQQALRDAAGRPRAGRRAGAGRDCTSGCGAGRRWISRRVGMAARDARSRAERASQAGGGGGRRGCGRRPADSELRRQRHRAARPAPRPNLIWQDSRELSRTSNASSSIMLSSELAGSSTASQPRRHRHGRWRRRSSRRRRPRSAGCSRG